MDNNFVINKCNMKRRYMGYVSVNVDVDIDDILFELNRGEKHELFEALKDDLGIEDMVNGEEIVAGTVTEQELFNICNKIYDNRNSLTNEDRELLRKLSKKGWYEKVV